jgi:hypothetical protein
VNGKTCVPKLIVPPEQGKKVTSVVNPLKLSLNIDAPQYDMFINTFDF